jgi:hypothetical protein
MSRASTSRTKNISFRLFPSTTHHEVYRFLDVPYDIVLEKTAFATNNELQGEQPVIDYGIMQIGDSLFALPMNIANEMIRDLQGRIDPSKQRYRMEYRGWTRNLHRASVHDYQRYFDETSDAWANPLQMNTGNYNLPYTQNQAAAAVHFQGHR